MRKLSLGQGLPPPDAQVSLAAAAVSRSEHEELFCLPHPSPDCPPDTDEVSLGQVSVLFLQSQAQLGRGRGAWALDRLLDNLHRYFCISLDRYLDSLDRYLDSIDRYLDRRTQTVGLGPIPAEAVAVEGGGARHGVAAVAAEPGDTEIFVDM